MTVARMRTEMSNAEFMRWQKWSTRRAQLAEVERKKGR